MITLTRSLILMFALGLVGPTTHAVFAQDDGLAAPAATADTADETQSKDVELTGVVTKLGERYKLQLVGGPIMEGQVRTFRLVPHDDGVRDQLDKFSQGDAGNALIKGTLLSKTRIDVTSVAKGSSIVPLIATAPAPAASTTGLAKTGLGPAQMLVNEDGIANVEKKGTHFKITPINQGPLSPGSATKDTSYTVVDLSSADRKVLEDAATNHQLVNFSGYSMIPNGASKITLESVAIFHGLIPLMAPAPTKIDTVTTPLPATAPVTGNAGEGPANPDLTTHSTAAPDPSSIGILGAVDKNLAGDAIKAAAKAAAANGGKVE